MFETIRVLAGKSTISKMLQKHFHGHAPHTLVTTGRSFPLASRVDVQLALDDFFSNDPNRQRLGLHSPHQGMQAIGISQLLQRTPFPIDVGPLQYDDVDIGEPWPPGAVREGWLLSKAGGLPFAVLIGRGRQWGLPLGDQDISAPPGTAAAT